MSLPPTEYERLYGNNEDIVIAPKPTETSKSKPKATASTSIYAKNKPKRNNFVISRS